MKYYECMYRVIGCPYSFNGYDFTTDVEEEIIKILEARGYEVLEVYAIKEQ
jgi:hypothetical protein